ncbi:MAG: hypothetical protein RLY86_3328 [Pseudomonadota bacterium]
MTRTAPCSPACPAVPAPVSRSATVGLPGGLHLTVSADMLVDLPMDLLVRPGDDVAYLGQLPVRRLSGRHDPTATAPVFAVIHRGSGSVWTHVYQLVRRGGLTEVLVLTVSPGEPATTIAA